jgi:uncharacterized protein YjiS (DUF1127 family)
MIKFIKRVIEVQKTERELSRLSVRDLTDIGIAPSDIRDIARRGMFSPIF